MADALLDGRAFETSNRGEPAASWGGRICRHETRATLLQLSIGCVEDLRRTGVYPGRSPEAFCQDYQICLPYRGLFVWHVGGEDVVGDPNQVLFVRGGEAYRMSGRPYGGYGEIIITPGPDLISEMAHINGRPLDRHPLFVRRTRLADPRLQILRARFLHWARSARTPECLEAEELVIALLRSALAHGPVRDVPGSTATARLIQRAKEFLEANLSARVRLTDVGRAVGASPAYLTDVFSRFEGLSLHQYLTRLRLGRSLLELPHAGDLTALALDLGFSSHSHFSFVFRRTFGCTPSRFRETTAAERSMLSSRLGASVAAVEPYRARVNA